MSFCDEIFEYKILFASMCVNIQVCTLIRDYLYRCGDVAAIVLNFHGNQVIEIDKIKIMPEFFI